jgi:acid phosphatase (class A)
MRMSWKLAAILAAATMVGAEAPKPAPKPLPQLPQPYMGEAAPDTYKILPPAPAPNTFRWQADRSVFLETRKFKDTPRWAFAQGDVNSAGLIQNMSCAVGVELSQQRAPKTTAMLFRAARDSTRMTNLPKDIYKRPRPYLVDEGAICVDRSEDLAKSPDYPSGHNTFGWMVGLILAELAPDRATPILARARAFGEGRLVCGVHSLSAVEAGRMNGSILVAGLHGSAEFRKDMEIARQEIAALRKAGPAPDPSKCAKEAEMVAINPY